jgi:hypothetical protein
MKGWQLTFSRRIDQSFESSLEAIARWHPDPSMFEEGCARIDSPAGAQRYRLLVRMRRVGRPVPMELVVSPWSWTAATHVELLPLRAVRPNREYFVRARALLDDVAATIGSARPADIETFSRCA